MSDDPHRHDDTEPLLYTAEVTFFVYGDNEDEVTDRIWAALDKVWACEPDLERQLDLTPMFTHGRNVRTT